MKSRNVLISCCMLLLLGGHAATAAEKKSAAQSGAETFTNPVIMSDVPDVDVIRVGSDYYMVSTTAHMSPGAPIMHSKDLVNWEIVSYLYDELDESPRNNLEGGNIYSRGQWAACIRYHKGVFYVFFGTGNKSYLYTTKDPHGSWEKKMVINEYLHDASMLFDDDGKVYLVYGAGHIRIIEFEPDFSGIKKSGLNVEVISGEPKGLLEGTHLYKYGKKYYMTLIWWPQGGIRTQLCFRSDKISGPYEMKTILSDDLGFAGHGVAQGCFIETPKGDWYAMLFQDHEAIGRVPVLTPCRWVDGWPILGDANGKVPPVMKMPVKSSGNHKGLVVSDEFNTGYKLGLTWQWNHNPDNTLWSLSERPGFLRLTTGKVVNNLFEARNTLTQRTQGTKCSGIVALELAHMEDGDCTGLAAFCSDPGTISVIKEEGQKYLIMTDRSVEKARVPLNQDRIYLKMQCDFTTDNATFSYSTDYKEWHQLGDKFHMIFSMAHFTGNKFAIFNYATKNAGGYVDVDFFHYSTDKENTPKEATTFNNPLLSYGPDPWALWHKGQYYYMHTMIDKLVLWKTPDVTDLKNAVQKTIWIPTEPSNSFNLWAPEIHNIKGKWYIYYTADDGNTDNHQMYVLENPNKDPFEGEFVMKGRISTDKDNNWAIDGSVFEYQGDWYMVWSGWQTRRVDTETQCIYIARLENPWTLGSERVMISKPELEWERHWKNEDGGWTPPYIVYVNEGPQPLKSPKGKYIHVVYSASGVWTPHYALGMLTAKVGDDLLNPASWKKSPQSIFRQSPENGVFGTGHNSFFKSPDGKEDYILYHARDTQVDPPGKGDTRSPRTQKIEWDANDYPVMGTPLPTSTKLPKPSGTKTK